MVEWNVVRVCPSFKGSCMAYAFDVVSAVALADTAVHVQPDSLGAATTAYNTACAHVCMHACMRHASVVLTFIALIALVATFDATLSSPVIDCALS